MWFRMAMSFCSVSTCKYDAKGPNSKADRACTMKILSFETRKKHEWMQRFWKKIMLNPNVF